MEKTALAEVSSTGRFQRTASVYRSVPSREELAEPDRFVLYVSLACPWANRCLAAVYLKRIEDRLRVSVVHPVWQRTRPGDAADTHIGWVFRDEQDDPVSTVDGYGTFDCRGCVSDPLGHKTVRELYSETDTKFTVPVLYDAKKRVIVNNESSEILRIINGWPGSGEDLEKTIDLYPVDERAEIDRINQFTYESINNGVYKCGFATSQVRDRADTVARLSARSGWSTSCYSPLGPDALPLVLTRCLSSTCRRRTMKLW